MKTITVQLTDSQARLVREIVLYEAGLRLSKMRARLWRIGDRFDAAIAPADQETEKKG